jgi:hypothetical protein
MIDDAEHLPAWRFDPKHRTLDLEFTFDGQPVHVWISPRPGYCDRGHWQFGVMRGPFHLDGADSFPRYFMSLPDAINEAERWLRWRLTKRTTTPVFDHLLAALDGRAFRL